MKKLILVLGLLAFTACENKTETPPEGDPVVTTEIPAEVEAEAKKEVTAENADAVAAELEKEIAEDTE